MQTHWLQQTFLGNSVQDYLWFGGILLAGFLFQQLFSRLVSRLIFRLIKKYTAGVSYDKFLLLLKKPLTYFVLLNIIYLAFDRLTFPGEWNLLPIEHFGMRMVLFKSFQSCIAISVIWIFLRLTDFFGLILAYRASLTASKTDDMLVPFLKESIKVIVAVFGILLILGTIFNLNITSLIAGLGIGGLAFALAAKESLENLLGSFTIFLDKPFQVDDVVQFGNTTGTIERIGFRSTRIRTPEKTTLSVPNKKLVDTELENLTQRHARKIKFFIALTYATKSTDLKKIITDIEKYLQSNPIVLQKDIQVKLFNISDSSLQLLVEFFINKIEYDSFLIAKQEVNFKVKEIVEQNNGAFFIHERM